MRVADGQFMKMVGARFRERVQVAAPGAPARATQPNLGRLAWLSRNLAQDRARELVYRAEVSGAVKSQADAIRALSQERIIGQSDLLDMNYLELAIAISRAVARLRLHDGYGTGFLVGPGIIMTNQHVIENRDDALQAVAQFDYQEDSAGQFLPIQSFRLNPEKFFTLNPTLDFALVGVEPRSAEGSALENYPWVKLIESLGKATKGDPVNIIQHPRGGPKQIALRRNEIIEIPEAKKDFLYYTTDTEPGSSGSPCFNDQWELVALHHSGAPRMEGERILKKDGTPWREGVDDPSTIDWVGNEGTRVSAIVGALKAEPLGPAAGDLRDRMLGSAPPNPVELARGKRPPSPNQMPSPEVSPVSPAQAGKPCTWILPIKLTISLGQTQMAPDWRIEAVDATRSPAPSAPAVEPSSEGALEAVVIDPDWKSREGYDPSFLGMEIPLPKLSPEMQHDSVAVPEEYQKDNQPYILAYHHYSLAMNKKRRIAWFSAANIDGDHRFTLPKRKDKWFIDPRIDSPDNPINQMGEELYAGANTDRGHLTRYLDVAWGESLKEATAATNDTFHFTNCTLQLAGFNEGKDRWQGLEQFLLENKARKEKRRMVVITGPVLRSGDPVYRNPSMNYSTRVPLQFWKVCGLVRQDGSLAATGFILGQQGIAQLPGFEEKFDVTAAQVTIAEIQQLTGLDFGVLTENDHFAVGGAPGTLEVERPSGGKLRIKPLASFDDIVI